MTFDLEALLGPFALTVALIGAVVVLGRDHMRSDADDRSVRDTALAGWRAEQELNATLTDAIETRDRADAARAPA